ncbi:hypothetical protein NPX13_g1320 [Xylaria arbuscula]|uniref:Structure-specific endonuclease subunit SLX4 n=1 Tax=Xylaria arbuscula TaxID=114810 RepID=A0A9W8NMA5_9PEZI|nr:hypothetical protein NPX13_g1320 [Xylaria arbuscula]
MSSSDVFLSSPPRAKTSEPIISSSSPCLPSLDEIFSKKSTGKRPLLASNRPTPASSNVHTFASASLLLRDAPDPDTDTTETNDSQPTRIGNNKASTSYSAAFTSAASLLRDAPEIDIDTEEITYSPPRRDRKNTVGRRRKGPIASRSPNGRVLDRPAIAIGSLSPEDKPWQKFVNKSPARGGDQSLASGSRESSAPRSNSAETFKTASKHPRIGEKEPTPENNLKSSKSGLGKEDSLDAVISSGQRESAIPRRGDWTPPRPNNTIALDSDSDAQELFSSVGKQPASKDVFQTLYSQYGRQDDQVASEPCQQPQVDFLKKRKRIELISTGQNDSSVQCQQDNPSQDSQGSKERKKRTDAKTPAPKKKARTITELAIAPFAPAPVSDVEVAGPATKDSMLDYFDSDGAVKALVEHQTAVMSQRKPKAKETKQPAKTKRKKKAGTVANPILLSPSTALKQSSNQDFVFGTSSQLVQEESPTTLRDLQAAIRASNSLNSDPFDIDVSRRLWHAGARDEEGELMEMEVVDLQHSPAIVQKPNSTATPGSRSFVDINDILDTPIPASSSPNSKQTNSHFFQSQPIPEDSSVPPCEPSESKSTTSVEPRPNYELFTDAQLSKQITSYGFKVVKKRSAMIALLDQCWQSKHQGTSSASAQPFSTSAPASLPAQPASTGDVQSKAPSKPRGRGRKKKDDNVAPASTLTPPDAATSKRPRGRSKKTETASASEAGPSTSIPSPKRPRGRPRKPSIASVEIPDSENEMVSPVSSPEPEFSSPPPLDLTPAEEDDMSLALSPTDDKQAELFKHITKAVTSAPRSKDPANPSWHEKMLLYDPVILEELASWLNGGELTRVGYDEEVSPFDVKKWCESKSVICLWRQGINGRERKRY